MAHGKRYAELKKLVDPKKIYSPEAALELVKKTSGVKFDASVEVHIRLTIDPTKGEQQVRGTAALPHGTGKSARVAAFVSSGKEQEAKDAGADIVGGEELIAEIQKTSRTDFDVAVATPDMMPKLAKLAKLLGPKGLMPNPKSETVTTNVAKTVAELKKGKVAFKNDDTGNIHQAIGKVSFDSGKLLENLQAFMDALRRVRPASAKGTYIKSAVLVSTMGPAVRVSVA
ncbi:MAG: 50S ribosomal protein L1 [Patescibacteria group bacterium]